jgi:hypothetical protein
MMTPPDPFSQRFDSINVERAPMSANEPGFYLADDAGGRFVVDREFGVVSLRDETLLAAEQGQVRAVQLRVVESSGHSYVMDLQLRVTGMVPQMVGAEDFGFGSEGFASPPARATPVQRVPWTAFAPARGLQTKPPLELRGAYGVLISTTPPASNERVAIAFGETIPSPFSEQANWSILV